MEVFVAGQSADEICCSSPREGEYGGKKVGDSCLHQEKGQPLRNQLQRGQVMSLLSWHLPQTKSFENSRGKKKG